MKRIVRFRDTDVADKMFDNQTESKVAQFEYTLDAAGNRTAAVEKFDADNDDQTGTDGLEKEQSFAWKYDALNRLIEESFDTAGSADDYIVQYAFDLASNRKTLAKDNGNATPGGFAADETTTYSYDSNDRLTQEVVGTTTGDTNTEYEYNGTTQTDKTIREGTIVGSGTIIEDQHYAYDVIGRMSQSVVTKGGVTTTSTYTYNDQGIRVQQTTDDTSGGGTTQTTTNYVIDANNHTGYAQVLEEKNASGGVTKTYTIGHDVLAQQAAAVAAGAVLRFLYDGHGSTRALVSGTGSNAGALNDGTAGLQLFTYDAYGNLVALPGAGNALTTLLYSGELTDATTGLQYLRARYYDPAMGRFTTFDPYNSTDPVSLHKYLYANGNPVMGIDPTGMLTFPNVLAAGAIGTLLGAIGGGVIGGIRGGIRGAVDGFAWGAVVGAGTAVAIVSGGAWAVAPALGVSQLSGIWITHTAATAAFAGWGVWDVSTAKTNRERAAGIAGILMTLAFWGYGTYQMRGIQAGRGTYENLNPNATPAEKQVGKFLANELRLDLVGRTPTGPKGLGTTDYAIRLSADKTIELKDFTNKISMNRVIGDALSAQGADVAIILKPNQFPAEQMASIAPRIFGFKGSTHPKQNIWIIEEQPNGFHIVEHHQRRN